MARVSWEAKVQEYIRHFPCLRKLKYSPRSIKQVKFWRMDFPLMKVEAQGRVKIIFILDQNGQELITVSPGKFILKKFVWWNLLSWLERLFEEGEWSGAQNIRDGLQGLLSCADNSVREADIGFIVCATDTASLGCDRSWEVEIYLPPKDCTIAYLISPGGERQTAQKQVENELRD